MFIHIDTLNENITRVVYDYRGDRPGNSVLISDEFRPCGDSLPGQYEICGGRILFRNRQSEVVLQETGHELAEKEVFRYYLDGAPVVKRKQTANGEVSYVENIRRESAGSAFEGKIVFDVDEGEWICGLGQHEDGPMTITVGANTCTRRT